ncbi:MAG TPA: redoxin domain-containing protein [Anaerolineae bacterium]|nr:redoxin domain-containing protein [Anaerolineae bacterium]
MTNDQWPMTKTGLFKSVGLWLGLLAVVLLVVACGTAPAVEQPGLEASPVAVAGTDEPAPVPPTATPSTALRASSTETVEPTVTDAPRPTPDASPTMATPIPGAQMAPDFRLPDLDGRMWTLSQFRGRPVLLFVWATW